MSRKPHGTFQNIRCAAFALAATLLVSACSFRRDIQPSVLVIMVDGLGFNSFSCGEGQEAGAGFQVFCDEAVRYTHAYTPSPLSQPAVATLLTGRYPFEHGVRHNGPQYLQAKETTVAEAAGQMGFRTSFYSGGPPIWRRSAFNQGFAVFDDSAGISINRLYKPAGEVARSFLDWQDNEASRGKFFSFLYFADPQFIDAPTANEEGIVRESSYSSQIDEVDEVLFDLVKELKRRKVWDSTDVILVGLDGHPGETRDLEFPMMNLFSERTRSTLMIKPSRKRRDGPFNWKIDNNVTLADVGHTLFELVGAAASTASKHSVSLRKSLVGPEADWAPNRMVVSESAWSKWRGFSTIRAAVRRGSLLYIYDEKDSLYDTLTDSMEAIPIPAGDERTAGLRAEMREFLSANGFERWKPLTPNVFDKLQLARVLWRDRMPAPDIMEALKTLGRQYPDDPEIRGWRAIWAMRLGDWPELKVLAKKDRPFWAYVASRNIGEKTSVPASEPCLEPLRVAAPPYPSPPKGCAVEGVHDLLISADESAPEEARNKAMESFIRTYSLRALSAKIAEHNYVGGLSWDTQLDRLIEPDPLELLLVLPEMKKVRTVVRTRVAVEKR